MCQQGVATVEGNGFGKRIHDTGLDAGQCFDDGQTQKRNVGRE